MVFVKYVRIRMVMYGTVLKERVIPDGLRVKWLYLYAVVRDVVGSRSVCDDHCKRQTFTAC